ncbi:DUF262 domain-containing protein [Candidatus Saccharibacteria bacterium]|nr:DUF262 domain-containing protein [Candidatus Saccharibacteria bacterium]
MDDLHSLQKLFTDRIFRIPDYQRGYSWGLTQLSELWEDINNLPEDKDHYTGMITLRTIDPKIIAEKDIWYAERWLVQDRDYEADYIVDGQQRLTTFIILISTIVDFCKKHNISILNKQKIADIENRYLFISEPNEAYNTYIFGYETDNPSYNFFKSKIIGNVKDSEKSDTVETFYTLNLENAKNFFRDNLESLYGGQDGEQKNITAIEKIYRKITQRMKFNLYNISDDFSVFVTFETMNNRGKRLSTLELLKNRLIYLSTLLPDRDESKLATRININNAWKEIYEFLGKNKLNPLRDDDYLQAHWIVYFGYQTREESNFSNSLLKKYFTRKRIMEYSDEITEDEPASNDSVTDDEPNIIEPAVTEPKKYQGQLTLSEINEYVASIKVLVKYWYALSFPDDVTVIENDELKKILKRLNRLGYNYFKPLATVILSKENLTTEQKISVLTAMERYIFLHFRLAGNVATSNRSPFYKLAKEFYHDRVTYTEVLESLADIECVQNGVLRTDLVYVKNFQNLFDKYDGYYSWQTLRYFLYEYETNLKDKNRAAMKVDPAEFFKADDRDKVSIEHIYPQTPQGTWLEKPFNEYEDEEKKRLTGTLGNLLPLSQAVNSSAQNKDFAEKRERYLENSHSAVNVATIEDENGKLRVREAWTPEMIKERGLEMLNFMASHYGFKFRNEYDMLKLLGLTFMAEEDEESWEDFKAEYNAGGATSSNVINVINRHNTGTNDAENYSGIKTPRLKRRKITPEVVQEAYAKAKEVHDGKTDMDTALDYLEQFGNRNSMNMYIYAFEAMLDGRNYTMDINPYALEYYVEHILADYGEGYRENIIKTLKERVKRYKGERLRIKEEDVLEKLEAK